jgi:hypothetical protein
MTILEFADIIDQRIEITYHPNQDNRWSAHFSSGEIKEGVMLCSAFENGKTPMEALYNYAKRIAGQKLVFYANSTERKEYVVPKGIV